MANAYINPDWTCIHGVINHQCRRCHPVEPKEFQLPEPPQEMTSLREIKQRLATIEERLELLLAIKDDTVRFRELVLKRFDMLDDLVRNVTRVNLDSLHTALSAQISGGFDGTVDGYNRVADELKQLVAAIRIFASAEKIQEYNRGFHDGQKARTKRRSKKR